MRAIMDKPLQLQHLRKERVTYIECGLYSVRALPFTMKDRLVRFMRTRRKLIWAILAIAFLLFDAGLASYTTLFTTADLPSSVTNAPGEILSVHQSSLGSMVVETDGGVFLASRTELVPLQQANHPAQTVIGETSDAVAVLEQSGSILFYPGGSTVPSFNKTIVGEVQLLGILETFGRDVNTPQGILVVVHNISGTFLSALSVAASGNIATSLRVEHNITLAATSAYLDFTALSIDNGSVLVVNRINLKVIGVIVPGSPVQQLAFSRSGMDLFILTNGSGAKVIKYDTDYREIAFNVSVPASGPSLAISQDGDWVVLGTSNDLYSIDGGGAHHIQGIPAGARFAVPEIRDKVFIATGNQVLYFHVGRESPVAMAVLPADVSHILTDLAGYLIVGWNANQIFWVDNSHVVLGAHDLWFVQGVALIAEGGILAYIAWGRRLMDQGSHALYFIGIGAMAGLFLVAIMQDRGAIAWFGSEWGYGLMAILIGAVAGLVAWTSQSGAWGIVLGAVGGLLFSIPLGLTLAFFLWSTGYTFPANEEVFRTIGFSLGTGLIAGVAGSIGSSTASRFIK